MNKWYEKVLALANSSFRSAIKTFKNHAPTILNYFRRRASNASAEAFNSKVKIFRSQMRDVRTVISLSSVSSSYTPEFLTLHSPSFYKCTVISACAK